MIFFYVVGSAIVGGVLAFILLTLAFNSGEFRG
jgi:hypothetical protein